MDTLTGPGVNSPPSMQALRKSKTNRHALGWNLEIPCQCLHIYQSFTQCRLTNVSGFSSMRGLSP